jgi:hypothetical protein
MKYEFQTEKLRTAFYIHKYVRGLEEKRGHNYEYWSDRHDSMLENSGYSIAMIETIRRGKLITEEATTIEGDAKDKVVKLRAEGNYARIVCGYRKDVQRTKYFTVIFKPKKQQHGKQI